ncbi:MAG TPA: MFS transporter [Pseudonocardiaceae bacterium]
MTTRAAPREATDSQRQWWALVAISVAQLMVTLDSTIVAIALPSAQADLGISDSDRQWVLTAYTLAFGCLLLTCGRITDLIGHKRSLIIGLLGFAVMSAVGGAAANGWMLIGARAAQGVFAAVLTPSTLALVNTTFTDERRRGKAFGVFGAILVTGGALGLIAGGLITQYLSWRWCLYVNLPVAVLALVGAAALLPRRPGGRGSTLDLPGAVIGCCGMSCLVYGFGTAATRGWDSTLVIGLLLAAVALVIAFVAVEARSRNPLVAAPLVRSRDRAGAFLTLALSAFALFGMFLFLTYELQGVLRYSPLRAGAAFLPLLLANILMSSLVTGPMLSRVQPRMLLAPGLLAAAIGMVMLTTLSQHSTFLGGVLPAEVVLGLGLGTVMAPSASIATANVDPGMQGIVSALVSTSQQIGGAVGTALLNTVAASTAAAYEAAHRQEPGADVAATVDGYAMAGRWAAVVLVLAAALAAALINARPQPKTPAPSD